MGSPMARNPDRNELFASLVEAPDMGEPREEQSQALIRRVESMEQARDWLGVFEQFLPEDAADALGTGHTQRRPPGTIY